MVSGRSGTLTIALALLVALVGVGSVISVPVVALGPGPTVNTLGDDKGKPVITVVGHPVFPTTGHLDMTTVSVTDQLRLFDAVGSWLSPSMQVVPRTTIYPPELTNDGVKELNNQLFTNSESDAEIAALTYLHEPTKVTVAKVEPDAPARDVLHQGDRLISVNGQPVGMRTQVVSVVAATRPGDKVQVVYQRGDSPPVHGVVTVGIRPGGEPGSPKGYLGIYPSTEPVNPVHITIALADVGGPSAGLMFTLGVLDKITPDDLTAGKFIAGTGTIEENGAVGPISGIPHKMVGARAKGATVFLVPDGNCKEAASSVPDGMRLVRVGNLNDAVNALQALKAGRPVPGC